MTNKTPMRGTQRTASSGALYQAKTTVYIDGRMVPPGETVEYDGLPGDNLIPLNAKAKAAAKKNKDLRKAQYEGDTPEERYAARQEALREADNELLGIGSDDDEPFPEPDPELEKHAEQTRKDAQKAEAADPDRHTVKMTGEQTNTVRASTDNTPADKSKPDAAKAK